MSLSEALKRSWVSREPLPGDHLHIQRLGSQTNEFIPSGQTPRIPIQLPSDSWTNLNCIYAVSLQRLPACGKSVVGRKDKKNPLLCQDLLLALLQGGTTLPSVPFSYKAPRAKRARSTFTPLQL